MKNSYLFYAVGLVFLMLQVVSIDLFASELKDGVMHVEAVEANGLMKADPAIQILDIRTSEEFDEAHIKGAINIDYFAKDFAKQLETLDPDKTYLVHCRSGGRSGRSLPILKSLGFTQLIHLDGGIRAWRREGLGLGDEP